MKLFKKSEKKATKKLPAAETAKKASAMSARQCLPF